MPIVALKRCRDYDLTKKALDDCLNLLGGPGKFIKPGMRILVKPNICDPYPPGRAATTHPALVSAMIDLINRLGAKAFVGENSSGDMPGNTARSFRASGIEEATFNKAMILNFQDDQYSIRYLPEHIVLKKADFPSSLMDMDMIINMPKLKTHALTYMTGAIKNVFGCVHARNRKLLHNLDQERFSDAILDIYSYLRPSLTVMDAVISMEGRGGPGSGIPFPMGYLIASQDGVSADAVAARIMGYSPSAIPLLMLASRRGLGTIDIGRIEMVGDPAEAASGFSRIPIESEKGQPLITARCVRCGVCSRNCPVGAITFENNTYTINEARCIRCLCCFETCTSSAIDIIDRQEIRNHHC